MRATMAFMDHLGARRGERAGTALSSARRVGRTYPRPGRELLAACFARAPGMLGEELPFRAWDDERFETLGRAVGRVRARTQVPGSPWGWSTAIGTRAATVFNPHARNRLRNPLLASVGRSLAGRPAASARRRRLRGLIHADLHGGNFMLDPGFRTASPCSTSMTACAAGTVWTSPCCCTISGVLTAEADKDAFAAASCSPSCAATSPNTRSTGSGSSACRSSSNCSKPEFTPRWPRLPIWWNQTAGLIVLCVDAGSASPPRFPGHDRLCADLPPGPRAGVGETSRNPAFRLVVQ